MSTASGFRITTVQSILHDEPGCAYFDADGLILSTRFYTRLTGQADFAAAVARADHVAVPGVGDEAIWIERVWNLWSWQGDTLVMIGVGKIGDTPARFALARKFADLIVPRFAT